MSSRSSLQPTAQEYQPSSTISDFPILSSNKNLPVSATATKTTPTTDIQNSHSDFPPLVNIASTSIQKKSSIIKTQQIVTLTDQPLPKTQIKKAPGNAKNKTTKTSLASPLSPQTKETKTKEVLPKPIGTKVKTTTNTTGSVHANTKSKERQVVESGSQFDLLRLYQNGTMSIPQPSNSGQFVQRITPKKKKFSSLKKKVLEERLRQWQAVNGIIPENVLDSKQSQTQSSELISNATTVCVYGFAYEIEDDDDEYAELIDNLHDMASKIGCVHRVFIPRTNTGTFSNNTNWPAFVEFRNATDHDSSNNNKSKTHEYDAIAAAKAAVQCWSALMLGGQTLTCRLLPVEQGYSTENADRDLNDTSINDIDGETLWRNHCLSVESVRTESLVDSSSSDVAATETHIRSEVLLNNILTDDDLEDEDCLEESLIDIRKVASQYGEVGSLVAVRGENDKLSTHVLVTYTCDADNAVRELNKVIFGGQPVVATLASTSSSSSSSSAQSYYTVEIRNLITDDDLEDESCLKESLNDVKELATHYGQVENITVRRPDDHSKLSDCNEYSIHIYFPTMHEAKSAVTGFDGMLIGGQSITAVLDGSMVDDVKNNNQTLTSNNEPVPMYSGDKLISDRFAECKRVPKVVNQNVIPRPYAKIVTDDESIKSTIIEMLSELMRLQRRALEENNVKAKRRLVMGLREVARGIRSHKVKLVIMANNLDEYGAIDKTVQDIIDLAKTEEVPIYYELNKRSLGKAVGKSIKVAVVGVQSADGAHQQYKKLLNYAAKHF